MFRQSQIIGFGPRFPNAGAFHMTTGTSSKAGITLKTDDSVRPHLTYVKTHPFRKGGMSAVLNFGVLYRLSSGQNGHLLV